MPTDIFTEWTDDDFDELGWNNNRVYGFILPGRSRKFTLLLDYALRNPLSKDSFSQWELVPVQLTFENVINLVLNIDSGNYSETDIVNVVRQAGGHTPNGKMQQWDYRIELSPYGLITFTATSFIQTSLAASSSSEKYDLDRENTFLVKRE